MGLPPLPSLLARVTLILGLLLPPAAADPSPPSAPEPAPAGAASAKPPPAATEELPFLSRHRHSLLIVAGVGAAASGLGALLLRREANDRYEDYERTADPQRMIERYDDTSRLDNQAAACFIAAEALFIFAIYLGFFVEPAGRATGAARPERRLSASRDSRDEVGSGPALLLDRGLRLRWTF
jgi:hypothetical protein